MATSSGRTRCVTCGKENATSKCAGCLHDFCLNHLVEHRQQLSKQSDEIEVSRDIFRQTLTEQSNEPQKHSLIKQIDEWEHDSINKIQQTGKEVNQVLFRHIAKHITQLENKLNKLTDQLRESREENDIIETDLDHWKDELTQLTEQLIKPRNITIRHDSTPLVAKIYVDVSSGKI
jgi:predicted transcriptional regulator